MEYNNTQFSPDGKSIIYSEGDAAFSMAIDTLAVTQIPYTCPSWLTADGKYLLFTKYPK